MKKINLIFVAECIVILCLLLLIGSLIKSDNKQTVAEDMVKVQASGEPANVAKEVLEEAHEEVPQEASENISKEFNMVKSTTQEIENRGRPQIVVFGDSIWNAGRGEDGISEQIMEEKDVIIYNCSIGGTTAAVYNESVNWESWTSNSFNGMMYLTTDIIEPEQLIPNDAAAAVFQEIDFNQVDYLIVSYGLNDYFCDIPIFPKEYYDLTSYVGALRHGIRKIQKNYPDIKIVLTSPTYCGWFEGERQFGLGDYVEAARGVAAEMNTCFLDMYHALGKNPQEKTEYLEDGVHLTAEGRYLYARSVIDFLDSQGIQ